MFYMRAKHNPTYHRMLSKLLIMYRNEPCLWDSENKYYHNKKMRVAALDKLLGCLRAIEPEAERCDVVRKINCLRTSYRKERKKVEASLGTDEVYQPTLWYYNMLCFLDDPINEEEGISTEPPNDYSENTEHEPEQLVETSFLNANDHSDGMEQGCPKEEYLESGSETSHENLLMTSIASTSQSSRKDMSKTRPKFARKRPVDDDSQNAVFTMNDYVKRNTNMMEAKEDRHDVYCKSIAMKLKCLDKRQRIIAEKLINEVMFEAELGNLNTDFTIARGRSSLS